MPRGGSANKEQQIIIKPGLKYPFHSTNSHIWMGLNGMYVYLLRAGWNGMKWTWIYLWIHMWIYVSWIGTLNKPLIRVVAL